MPQALEGTGRTLLSGCLGTGHLAGLLRSGPSGPDAGIEIQASRTDYRPFTGSTWLLSEIRQVSESQETEDLYGKNTKTQTL